MTDRHIIDKPLFRRQLDEFSPIEHPGQAGILRTHIALDVSRRHDTPEVLGFQLCVIICLDKDALEGVSCLERDLNRFTAIFQVITDEFFDLVICHIKLIYQGRFKMMILDKG
jgi:hypothetical protein